VVGRRDADSVVQLFTDFYGRTAGHLPQLIVTDEYAPYEAVIAYGTGEIAEPLEWLAHDLPRRYLGMVGAMGYESAAREQIEQSVSDLRANVSDTLNWRSAVRRHPLPAFAGAALIGLILARMTR